MDEKLQLNLTVNELYFSLGISDCNTSLMISNECNSEQALQYCGYLSRFGIFPGMSSFSINISVPSHIYYKFNAHFTVIDSDLLISVEDRSRGLGANELHSMLIVKDLQMLISCIIQTKKIHYLILHILPKSSHKIVVYDGPGFLSHVTRPSKTIHKLSTFQCAIQVLTANDQNGT